MTHLRMNDCVQNVWPWLFDEAEDRKIFSALQFQLKHITKQQEGASAAVYHLECSLIAAACHDPGRVIERRLVLPLLHQRINAAAKAAAQVQAENQDTNKVGLCRRLRLPCNKKNWLWRFADSSTACLVKLNGFLKIQPVMSVCLASCLSVCLSSCQPNHTYWCLPLLLILFMSSSLVMAMQR